MVGNVFVRMRTCRRLWFSGFKVRSGFGEASDGSSMNALGCGLGCFDAYVEKLLLEAIELGDSEKY